MTEGHDKGWVTWSAEALEGGVGRREVAFGGVELVAHPGQEVVVLRMPRIGERSQKLLIAPGATHVLRRTGSSSIEAHPVFQPGRRPTDVFDHHLVDPRVAEVVLLHEARQAAPQGEGDGVLGLVKLVFGIVVELGSVDLPVDGEAVQV
jgi:hypothetical protein